MARSGKRQPITIKVNRQERLALQRAARLEGRPLATAGREWMLDRARRRLSREEKEVRQIRSTGRRK